MSFQIHGVSLSSSAETPMRRKRGRPRKDESVQGDNLPVTPASDSLKKDKQCLGTSNPTPHNMVGQMVSGVIEGSFDAGYLLNVKVGDTNTHLRGVVFLPGRFTPITSVNDVAPYAKMYKRKEISIPFVNSQSPLHAMDPPSGKGEKFAEHKNDTPSLLDQSLHAGVQSGAIVGTESQSASVTSPASNLPISDPVQTLGLKVLQEQTLDSGLRNDNAVGQNQSLLGFEGLKMMKGPTTNIEAPKGSEPVSVTITATLPATETLDLKPQAEHQSMNSGLKPSELVHNAVENLDLGNKQTSDFPEPQPQVVACGPTEVNLFEKPASSRQDVGISQDNQLELARKIINGDATLHADGLAASNAATNTMRVPCSASLTSLPVMIFGAESIPSELKPAADECVLPIMVGPGTDSPTMAANTSNVDCNAKDAIPSAHS